MTPMSTGVFNRVLASSLTATGLRLTVGGGGIGRELIQAARVVTAAVSTTLRPIGGIWCRPRAFMRRYSTLFAVLCGATIRALGNPRS